MIWQLRSSNCFGVTPFSVPCVPTGIKTGVLTGPCGSVSSEALALVVEHRAIVSNVSADFMILVPVKIVAGKSKKRKGAEKDFDARPTGHCYDVDVLGIISLHPLFIRTIVKIYSRIYAMNPFRRDNELLP